MDLDCTWARVQVRVCLCVPPQLLVGESWQVSSADTTGTVISHGGIRFSGISVPLSLFVSLCLLLALFLPFPQTHTVSHTLPPELTFYVRFFIHAVM